MHLDMWYIIFHYFLAYNYMYLSSKTTTFTQKKALCTCILCYAPYSPFSINTWPAHITPWTCNIKKSIYLKSKHLKKSCVISLENYHWPCHLLPFKAHDLYVKRYHIGCTFMLLQLSTIGAQNFEIMSTFWANVFPKIDNFQNNLIKA